MVIGVRHDEAVVRFLLASGRKSSQRTDHAIARVRTKSLSHSSVGRSGPGPAARAFRRAGPRCGDSQAEVETRFHR